MDNLPSIKTHPVIVSLITVTFFIAVLVFGMAGGWFLRAASESRAELSVVVDDGKFMQALEVQTQKWVEEFNQRTEAFYYDKEIPDCIGKPMPTYYHDNDYELHPTWEQEE